MSFQIADVNNSKEKVKESKTVLGLEGWSLQGGGWGLLLYHRPSLFDIFKKMHMDYFDKKMK